MVIETDRLIEAIRDLELTDPDRLGELGVLAERNPNLRDLGRLLIQQEWLTAYQVNQLLQGRGKKLLLGPYVLLERIATGGMGEVFKARHRRLQRIAAVKVVRRARLNHPNAAQRFRREAEVAAQLSHPNIVAVHDFGEEDDCLYLAMEFIDGVDLSRLVVQCGPLPVALASDFIRQAAIGLHHAHEQGFVHRDVKPQNLLVSPRARTPREANQPESKGAPSFSLYAGGTVKILDMGLIRLEYGQVAANEMALTQSGMVIGTMDYLAPEQALDSHHVDRRADLYSLGCTAYHLLAGRPPFFGGQPLDKLLRHQTDQPASIRQIRPDVPAELEAVLQKLLAKRPADRPATAADVALALVPFASKAPATAVMRKVAAPAGGVGAAPQRVPIPARDLSSLAPTSIIDPGGAERETPAPLAGSLTQRIRHPGSQTPSRNTHWWRVTAGVVVLLVVCAFIAFLPRSAPRPHDPPVKEEVDRLRDYVPAETAAVLQVQPRPFLGAAVFRRDKAARQPAFDPGATKLLDNLGVDMSRDVDRIRFCFPSAAADQALWIMQGRLDPARFSKAGRLQLLAEEPNGRAGLYSYQPPAGKQVYLGHHRSYLLASQQRQEVVSALDHAKTAMTAPPAEDMRRLLGRMDRDRHLWLAVACKQLGMVGRLTGDPLMDAALELFLKNASTIEVGLHCADDLRLRVRFQSNNDPSAKRIIETIKRLQERAKLGLALMPKKQYEKRLWLRLLVTGKVERRGLWVEVNSQVTAAMVG